MMKERRRISLKHIVFLCVCMLIGVTGIYNPFSVKTSIHAETEKTQQFDIDSKARIGNYVKQNKGTEIVSAVTNNGADFTGYIQIIMRNNDTGKYVMYQSDLVLAAGETKTISQEIRFTSHTNRIIVRITDTKEKVLTKKKIKLSGLDSAQCLIGILCDNKQEMGYWDSEKVAYLKKEDISSVQGMDIMDVLVINNFNTGDLEKEQYEAIKEWVELGGTLVLGTGEQVNRTLAMFQDDYLEGRIGDVKTGIADISFQGETITDDLADNLVLHRMEKGLGVVCVANKNLGMDKSLWNKKGFEYINAIRRQYSAVLQERLNSEDSYAYGYYGYGYRDGTILKDSDEIPSIKNFAILLFIYVILISLCAYLILKKKDRLEWTWGIVPLMGVIFAGIVIVMGSKTRINGSYINYKKVMEFQEGSSTVKNVTHMGVASSNNSDYEIAVPEGMEIYSEVYNDNYFDEDDESFDDYNIGFKTKDNQKIISLKNNGAFETVNLVSEEVETEENGYQSDIHYVNARISGIFTNRTAYTIKNAVLFAEGKLYQLGTIKPGEKAKITDKTLSTVCNYYYGTGRDYYKVLGISSNSNKWSLEEARYVNALEEIVNKYIDYQSSNSIVYGYMDMNDDDYMKEIWGMDCFGITLMKFPIQLNYTAENGDIYVSDILKSGQIINGTYWTEDHCMSAEKELVVDYTLDKDERLTGIYFSKLLNPSIDDTDKVYYGDIYEGKIEIFNWRTKKYEVIFEADREGEVTDVEDYTGEENTVRFRLKADNASEDEDIYTPVISLTKEVKTNG